MVGRVWCLESRRTLSGYGDRVRSQSTRHHRTRQIVALYERSTEEDDGVIIVSGR